jgi:hypothetical protein
MANGCRGRGAIGRGIDDCQRHALPFERGQPLGKVACGIKGFDKGIGIGPPALPIGERALLAGLDQADMVSGLDRGKREADGKRALAGATLLGSQYDRMHGWSLGFAGRGYAERHTLGCIAFARCRAILAQDMPGPIQRGSRKSESVSYHDAGLWVVAIPYHY